MMENFSVRINNILRSSNSLLLRATILLFILSGCTKAPSAGVQRVQTSPVPDVTLTTNPSESSARCIDLKQEIGLPMSDDLKKSHILYLASNTAGSAQDQIWVISIKDGSENILLNDIPSPFLAMGFLPNGYQFLLTGQRTMESDLGGGGLTVVDNPSIYKEDFPRYSSVWNLIADDPEAGLSHYEPMGNKFTLYSFDDIHVATWDNSFAINETDRAHPLEIKDKRTALKTEIVATKLPDAIEGANWSPDGSFLVFTLYRNTTPYYSQVYIVKANGSDLRPLSQRFELELLGRPRWSPDGHEIAIPMLGKDGWYHIIIISPSTGDIKRFRVSQIVRMNSIEDQGEMVWSPDSQWLAYISQSADHYGIEILNTETGKIYCGRNDINNRIEMMDWR